MSSTDRLFKLAAYFERKIFLKKAEEIGDTSMINVRPLINRMLVGREGGGQMPEPPPPDTLKAKVLNIIKKGAAGGGSIVVGGKFYFSAKKTGDNWVVSEAHVDASGSLLSDAKIGEALKAVITLFNGAAKAKVQAEVNRVKGNLQGDTITNMETFVDSFNFDLGD